MQSTRQLTDYKTNLPVETIPCAGLTPLDIAEFCAYFKVNFHSLEAITEPPNGLTKADMFRVSTNTVPSRGLDITFRSVSSWLTAMRERGDKVFENGRYRMLHEGEVVTVGLATSVQEHDPIVVYRCADGTLRYVEEQVFFGVTYDKATDTYRPNVVPIKTTH